MKHKILIEQTVQNITILINTTETPSEAQNTNRTKVQNITILINTTETPSETQNTNRTNSTKHHYTDKHNRNT